MLFVTAAYLSQDTLEKEMFNLIKAFLVKCRLNQFKNVAVDLNAPMGVG